MFGIAVASLNQISDAEKLRYQALYCGLCRALKDRYGQISRATLSYDLTFFIMLCNSLHESEEHTGESTCIAHPTKKMRYAMSTWTDYAADLSVALAYHKCLDDVIDDNSIKAKAAKRMLQASYRQAERRIPDQCRAIEAAMALTHDLETDAESGAYIPPDETSKVFGLLLGDIFSIDQGIWTEYMRDFGNCLGQFIYLMDAAVDLEQDVENGSYNPFATTDLNPDQLRSLLANKIGDAARIFEMLPLIQDVNIMRCVIYAGVWQNFNQIYEKAA